MFIPHKNTTYKNDDLGDDLLLSLLFYLILEQFGHQEDFDDVWCMVSRCAAWFTSICVLSSMHTYTTLHCSSLADIAGAKRLLFESQTLVLASLQDLVSLQDQSSVKKVPVAERETKMKIIPQKLCGLLIEGPLEPGHSLLDLAANMLQLNEIRYMPPDKCVSKTHEVLNHKTPSKQIDVASKA